MKNKNAFTLVELLAVIAILAILVIIALPNVMGMFNQAKKNSFMTEVKQIYKVAQQAWISDSMFNTSEKEYGRCDGCSYKELELSGRKEIKYYIKLNKSGKVVKYIVDDGTYRYEYNGEGLLVENITDDNINPSNGEELVSERYVYFALDGYVDEGGGAYSSVPAHIGQTIPSQITTFPSYEGGFNIPNANDKIFVRLKVSNNIVISADVAYVYNGVHFLTNNFSENKANMTSVFGSENCTTYDNTYSCSYGILHVSAHEDGTARSSYGSGGSSNYCFTTTDGVVDCNYTMG